MIPLLSLSLPFSRPDTDHVIIETPKSPTTGALDLFLEILSHPPREETHERPIACISIPPSPAKNRFHRLAVLVAVILHYPHLHDKTVKTQHPRLELFSNPHELYSTPNFFFSDTMSSSQQARGGSYFLSFLAGFRQTSQTPSAPLTSQASKHTTTQTSSSSSSTARQTSQTQRQTPSVAAQVSLHSSTRGAHSPMPIPGNGRRRGSESSSEGFREVNPAGGPWYIGGRTAAGEEKFFKLGVVRRVKSIDRLSIDRLSL
ncbi:hypothetical protein MKZ38_006295 [Zalerion maritima]|uniref:Uncharacterized protein n=1 Tax=Zalerion maritima TaxID=339359 RepID=A0AAD5RJM5_9PEZI|nr:hypothetical protein MKZ38_006295 [Zalerion maritima]